MADEKEVIDGEEGFVDAPIAADDVDAWGDLVEDFAEDMTGFDFDEEEKKEVKEEKKEETVVLIEKEENKEEEKVAEEKPVEQKTVAEEESAIEIPKVEGLEIPKPQVEERKAAAEGDVAKAREQYREQLMKQYALSQEEADELDLNPSAALPKIAAKLHIQVLENAMQSMHQHIPQMMQSLMVQQETARQNEQDFFKAWPDLQGHQNVIAEQASMFRQKNPNASKEEAIRMVGFNTMLALGVDPVKAAARLGVVPKAKAEEQSGVRKPHVPTARRAAAPAKATTPTASPYDDMFD